ncbi:hypothetical protein B0H66DRAFT_25932 [Apodospora peruviana]|uniref:Uncharacterized protein n=1 Tax=Apodospora peruviana TaxID=516989 RepID=A0AAE0MF64_9PEZI|nr:hypothetical protein B0H66DRAFT_25932 [Apodospora peruviana]
MFASQTSSFQTTTQLNAPVPRAKHVPSCRTTVPQRSSRRHSISRRRLQWFVNPSRNIPKTAVGSAHHFCFQDKNTGALAVDAGPYACRYAFGQPHDQYHRIMIFSSDVKDNSLISSENRNSRTTTSSPTTVRMRTNDALPVHCSRWLHLSSSQIPTYELLRSKPLKATNPCQSSGSWGSSFGDWDGNADSSGSPGICGGFQVVVSCFLSNFVLGCYQGR